MRAVTLGRFPMTANRAWVYQRERFPIAAHGPLIAVFSLSAITFSSLLRGEVSLPDPLAAAVAFASALLFFLQLRIADEFKDADEDARYRPYRPVPRGLVGLRELGAVAALAALGQLALALWLAAGLLPLLGLVWGYLALMSREFFVRRWLRARPITYLWSHMLIVPLIDLYVTACDWRSAGAAAPAGLGWLLAASVLNGTVVEIGRKIRAPGDEEHGVETYSVLWGRDNAVLAWLGGRGLSYCRRLGHCSVFHHFPGPPPGRRTHQATTGPFRAACYDPPRGPATPTLPGISRGG